MFVIEIADEDLPRIEDLLTEVMAECTTIDDEDFLTALTVYAQEMPRALRSAANRFRLHEPSGGCLFTGFVADDERIGDTPANWYADGAGGGSTRREDIFFLLCAALLGDPIAWATQQDGQLLHDVIPIKGHEFEQINSSTAAPLWWHTEDAFHPHRADYVGLMCLRNPDAAETTYAEFSDLTLDHETVATLSSPRYVIRPDESHLPKNRSGASRLDAPADVLERSYQWIDQMNLEPPKTPILFGDPKAPYGRLDPYFMDRIEDDPEAMAAFDTLVTEIDRNITGIGLAPGEVLFIDNYKSVHGRKPFQASFNGKDRWLRRVNVTRDLRKSRSVRVRTQARIIF
jgi:Fe(II)/alpha-ketoglutarate-dependent arginine beta-hydroxylase